MTMTLKPRIQVCAECLRRSCWDGIFYCDNFRNADLVWRTEAQLRRLGLEHPDHYMKYFKVNIEETHF